MRHGRAVELLRPIAGGMRQLAFVILNPNQISRIDPAVAGLASEIMFGLGDTPTTGALAEHRPAWSRFIE